MNRAQEIAWAAGILEGEGCFVAVSGRSVRVQCVMVDRDVVQRLRAALGGVGSIYLRPPQRPGAQPSWVLAINAQPAREVMRLILPFMGKRRSARIRQLLRGDLRTIAATEQAQRGRRKRRKHEHSD